MRVPSTVLAICVSAAACAAAVSTTLPAPSTHSSTASATSSQHFNSYTNHAGNVVSGTVIALDARTATISNAAEMVKLPLSIFPESEQRRIAADFLLRQGSGGQVSLLRVPVAVKRAISGAEKAMARSRKRAEKGLCSKEESDAFCEKSEAALKSYLDKQVKEGVITPEERKAIGR